MSVTATKLKNTRRTRRKRRVRAKISGTAERPRISVVRSNRGVSAQLIDDVAGNTIVAVNWTTVLVYGVPAYIAAVGGADLLCDTFFARMERGGGLPSPTKLPYFPDQALELTQRYERVDRKSVV
mgnify:CR=1 FL=1